MREYAQEAGKKAAIDSYFNLTPKTEVDPDVVARYRAGQYMPGSAREAYLLAQLDAVELRHTEATSDAPRPPDRLPLHEPVHAWKGRIDALVGKAVAQARRACLRPLASLTLC
eukprot:7195799-Prymnesium_polylepis.1